MQLIPVTDKATAQLFIQVAPVIYANDPQWARPLDKDIDDVFDEKKNKAFRHGKIVRWILKDDNGNVRRVSINSSGVLTVT